MCFELAYLRDVRDLFLVLDLVLATTGAGAGLPARGFDISIIWRQNNVTPPAPCTLPPALFDTNHFFRRGGRTSLAVSP